MTTPTNIYEQLRRDEGLRLKPYTDTVGKLTIGIGRNLTDVGITPDEANFLLNNDVDKVVLQLTHALSWFATMDPVRQGVLVNLGFNLGVVGLLAFHDTLSCLSHSDWDNAARALLDSKWAGQVSDRAQRLAAQLRTGEWQ